MCTWQSIEGDAAARQVPHQGDERHLRRVGGAGEHRLAEERAAQRHAVEPSDELVAAPRLDRVREPQAVEDLVGGDHLRGDPGAFLPRPVHRGAGFDDVPERGVEGDLVRPAAHRLGQAVRNVQVLGAQDHPGIGRVPEDREAVLVPGEDPLRVRGEQPLRPEVAADGEQPVLRELGGGKATRSSSLKTGTAQMIRGWRRPRSRLGPGAAPSRARRPARAARAARLTAGDDDWWVTRTQKATDGIGHGADADVVDVVARAPAWRAVPVFMATGKLAGATPSAVPPGPVTGRHRRAASPGSRPPPARAATAAARGARGLIPMRAVLGGHEQRRRASCRRARTPPPSARRARA